MITGQNKPKKIRKRSFWGTKFQSVTRKRSILALSIFTAGIAVLFLGFRIFRKTIGAPEHTIEKVVFAPESVNAIRDISLYANITNYLKGKNTILLNRFGKNELDEFLRLNHPLVDRLEFKESAPKTIFVTLLFHEPSIVRQTPTNYFISYNEDLYQVNPESVLIQGHFPIQLPRFSSGRNDINGIYRSMNESDLKKTISTIMETVGTGNVSEIIYQPGGKRLFVTYKGKRVYLNLNKNITQQLDSLIALEQNRAGFPNVRTIDIGSREEVIVK